MLSKSQRAANTGHPGIKQTLQRVSSVRDLFALSSNVVRGILRPVVSAASWVNLPTDCVPAIIACPSPTMTYGKHTIEAVMIFAMCLPSSFLSSVIPDKGNIAARYEARMNSW